MRFQRSQAIKWDIARRQHVNPFNQIIMEKIAYEKLHRHISRPRVYIDAYTLI